jgi:hypothetical protein
MSKKSKRKPARKARPVSEAQVDVDVAEVRALAEQEPAPQRCDQCGEPFALDASGIANHVTADGEVDHDADADHVPYAAEPEVVPPAAGSEPAPEPEPPVPLAPPPVLPADLTAHDPAFVTGRVGQLCDVAFALLPDVVVWRTTDRLNGSERTYMLAAWDDLCHQDGEYDPATAEPRSRAWYPVTDEDDARLAAWDVEPAPEHVPGGEP